MTAPPTCSRCDGPLHEPGLMTSTWDCDRHGAVQPYRRLGAAALGHVAGTSGVPVWSPLPLLAAWTLTGCAVAGAERTGARAVAVALTGPAPLGGPADLVLVAEEPGTGLGARLAGLDALDPGPCEGRPDGHVTAAGHETALWRSPSAEDRAAFVGEAGGVWLWAVLWPPAAELVLLEHVELHDVRHETHTGLDLPRGAPTARL